MTVTQTLGAAVTRVDLTKAKRKVQEVENDARFASVKSLIRTMITSVNPATEAEREKVRDRAIAFAMSVRSDFDLAVSQKLLQAFQNGDLKP